VPGPRSRPGAHAVRHSGERVMHELMRHHGGFEHNTQTLRILETLEERYPDFPGLNLTWEVREGIIKHRRRATPPRRAEYAPGECPTLEAQLVDSVDEIAYNNHDIDDGLSRACSRWSRSARWRCSARRTTPRLAVAWRRAAGASRVGASHHRPLHPRPDRDHARQPGRGPRRLGRRRAGRRRTARRLLARDGGAGARAEGLPDARDVPALPRSSDGRQGRPHPARTCSPPSWERCGSSRRASRIGVATEGLHRVVCDYIAGMTDRFALDEHRKLFDPLVKGLIRRAVEELSVCCGIAVRPLRNRCGIPADSAETEPDSSRHLCRSCGDLWMKGRRAVEELWRSCGHPVDPPQRRELSTTRASAPSTTTPPPRLQAPGTSRGSGRRAARPPAALPA